MTKSVGTVGPGDTLAKAVLIMWERDCGSVPVVVNKKPIGMVTDRDVAVAVSTSNRMATDILVREVIGNELVCCRSNDSILKVLKKMGKYRVRRLPVVDKKGRLRGIVTIADILKAKPKKKKIREVVLKTLSRIVEPKPIVLFEVPDK